jgi:hypothetical protein
MEGRAQCSVGVYRTWAKYIEKGKFPETRRYFGVLRCNHCDEAPCVETWHIARSSAAWRNAAVGNLGGWQVARALELLVVLAGAVGTPGGTVPNTFNKFIPAPPMMPPPPKVWNELLLPPEYPLSFLR